MMLEASHNTLLLVLVLALLLEWTLPEPSNRWHPVAWFGRWVMQCEHRAYADHRGRGVLLWFVVIVPPLGLAACLHQLGWWWDVLLLWLSIGWSSLFSHVQAVLRSPDLKLARQAVSLIVSRDTDAMSRDEINRAALESLAENASDAVIAALFWFVLLGPVGAAAYRMTNTLDAMWGYRHARYARFGWWAARVDDWANLLPARLTAVLMLFVSGGRSCWHAVAGQARSHASPNAGWPEAALAHAAAIRLGGAVVRRGVIDPRPDYGAPQARCAGDARAVADALRCVRHTLIAAVLVFALILYAV